MFYISDFGLQPIKDPDQLERINDKLIAILEEKE